MANAKPTLWTTEIAPSVGRKRRVSAADKIGSVPSVVFDPDALQIARVVEHSSLSGEAKVLPIKAAEERGLIQLADHGFDKLLLLLSSRVQVIFEPNTNERK